MKICADRESCFQRLAPAFTPLTTRGHRQCYYSSAPCLRNVQNLFFKKQFKKQKNKTRQKNRKFTKGEESQRLRWFVYFPPGFYNASATGGAVPVLSTAGLLLVGLEDQRETVRRDEDSGSTTLKC